MSTETSYQEKNLQIGTQPEDPEKLEGVTEDFEVFKQTKDGVNFRTVGWPMATVIFLKTIFALGVLSIPAAMYSLGAVGGALSVIGWQALNTYTAVLQGDFRNNHPRCHSIADMAGVVGGPIMKEVTGALFIIAYVILTGSGIVGVSIGINALSHHAACSVWWAVLATVFVALAASVRKFHQIGWLTWIGFASIFIAVFILVIAVTTRDRPAAAPQTGDYEFGFYAIAYPSFAAGMVASCTIFVSGAGTSAMLPVISEMKNPRDYRKALFICMAIVTAAYLSFSLVVYRWCGKWVASPSLGVSSINPNHSSTSADEDHRVPVKPLRWSAMALHCLVWSSALVFTFTSRQNTSSSASFANHPTSNPTLLSTGARGSPARSVSPQFPLCSPKQYQSSTTCSLSPAAFASHPWPSPCQHGSGSTTTCIIAREVPSNGSHSGCMLCSSHWASLL